MTKITLGKTGITTDRNAFGALPIQRIPKEEAARLLRRAYDGGFTFLIPPVPIQTAKKNWVMP